MEISKVKSFKDLKGIYEDLQKSMVKSKSNKSDGSAATKEAKGAGAGKESKGPVPVSKTPAAENAVDPAVIKRANQTETVEQKKTGLTQPLEARAHDLAARDPQNEGSARKATEKITEQIDEKLDLRLRRNKHESLIKVITADVRKDAQRSRIEGLQKRKAGAVENKTPALSTENAPQPNAPQVESKTDAAQWWERAGATAKPSATDPADLLSNVRTSMTQQMDVANTLHTGLSPERVMGLYAPSTDSNRLQSDGLDETVKRELFDRPFSQIPNRFDLN